jgi:hypothetical protein
MNIAQAMKARKRLVAQLQRVRSDIRDGNRIIVGNTRDVDIDQTMDRESALFEKLVELRTAIAVVNTPIWGKLLRMTELKEQVGFCRGIPTQSGRSVGRRSFMSDESPEIEWEVHLDKDNVDNFISDVERELATLQDEVDEFNATTEIDIDIPNDLLF